MEIYFVKVNLAIGLLYIIYRFLFRDDTFFYLRRVTLLGIILFAFLYPLPDLKDWVSQQPLLVEYVQAYSSVYQSNEVVSLAENMPESQWEPVSETGTVVTPSYSIDWNRITEKAGLGIYLSGVIILLFRCMAELFSVYRTFRRSRKQRINGMTVYVSPEIEEPYSFFRWVFIRPEKYSQRTLSEILIHESKHAGQWHSLDVVLGEIATILCWINPFAWLLKKEISINHEYIADQEVMDAGFNKKEYQYHLIGLEHSSVAAANLYNYFSVLPLKKRITMLNKKRMHRAGTIKYLTLVPLAAALLIVNNMDVMARIGIEHEPVSPLPLMEVATPIPPDDNKVYTVVDVMPKFPGGDTELLKFISKNIEYPAIAKENGIKGRVVISFVVEKDGSITSPEIVRGVDPSLDKEAIRVIKLQPKWTPGQEKGKVVRVKYTVPVQFKIPKETSQQPASHTMHKGEKVYNVVHKMPKYPGGENALMKFISDNIKYPDIAKENGIEGRVVISFIIEKDGTLADARVVRGVDPSIDKEAIRVAGLMDKWTPGEEDGQPVQVRYTVPVTFKL